MQCAGLCADATLRGSDAASLQSTSGTPYTAIPGAPGPPVRFDGITALSLPKGRCLDCGQVRIDKEYV